ncbi:MAG: trypsin-like peptidase domain-containing protein [Candidatus Bathyarchaeia archaeon]
MKRRSRRKNSNKMIAILVLVIIILGSVALYYSPLLDGMRARKLDPADIYANSSQSVVTVLGANSNSSVLGTGFVITYNHSYYIITNFHMVDGYVNSTVTFSDGNGYPARVVGSDGYSDLAIVSVNSPLSELHPLQLGSSSNLKVGETVVAIGNPYGLSNTVTVGIVSHTGRSLQTGLSGNFAIADTIQFSAPINPGNSGGPLINSDGMVVGITTASVTNSQGLGFAIPSDTISRELPSLVTNGGYNKHPYFGVQVVDMNYGLSQAMQTNVTSGVLIEHVLPDGPASQAGLRGGTQQVTIEQQDYIIGGDIITTINGHKIVNYDSFSAYLEENATSGQTIQVGIIRAGNYMILTVQLGTRPPILG